MGLTSGRAIVRTVWGAALTIGGNSYPVRTTAKAEVIIPGRFATVGGDRMRVLPQSYRMRYIKKESFGSMDHFEIRPDAFYFRNKPIQIISGAIHYFRVIPAYWEDRLLKLKACGMNAVETYVPWNAHEPRPAEFDFSGILDIAAFIRLAQSLDLLVIVRPSPYICAEWEFGGLPAWLLADPGMRLRCAHPPYLHAIDRYYDRLIPELTPLLCTACGPVIAMQIENEYGSYGTDREYLTHLEQGLRSRGVDVPLFTSDGPSDAMLQGGTLPHIYKTANFGSHAAEAFEKLREYQSDGPLMCMEFWNGWFDHWTEEHHTRDVQDAAKCLDDMLAAGASVNAYMFHGGTNFGFSNGANFDSQYMPTTTSYDYDAPLNEAGDPTAKYFAFREVIGKYCQLPEMSIPCASEKRGYGTIPMTEQALLLENLDNLTVYAKRATPEPMEMLGQGSGFILYRTHVSGPRTAQSLTIQGLHDRAIVFQDSEIKGAMYRNDVTKDPIALEISAAGSTLDILVENMGRINYGPDMLERKGIVEGVRLNNQFQHTWEIYTLPLDDLSGLIYTASSATEHPAFYRAWFEIDEPADTFVELRDWTKGVCFVNGFNLGRYWNVPPHRNLYLPGPLLKPGANEIVIFELHGNRGKPAIHLVVTAENGRQ